MSSQVQQIADDEYFIAMYNSGISRNDIARYYDVNRRVIDNACEFANLRPPSKHDIAPTPEEEEASRSSLALAPLVAKRVREVTELQVKFLRGEIEAFPWDRTSRRVQFLNGKVRGGS